jgi:hypothetical protein
VRCRLRRRVDGAIRAARRRRSTLAGAAPRVLRSCENKAYVGHYPTNTARWADVADEHPIRDARGAPCRPVRSEPISVVCGVRGAMKPSSIPALLLLLVSPSYATEVFFHDTGGVRWEAEVTENTFALRETRQGASTELVCPLGPAVRASVIPTGSKAGKVCLVFSRDKCAHKDVPGLPPDTLARHSAAGTFKCLDFATAEHASTLAALINAGYRTYSRFSSPRSPVGSKGPVAAARSSGPGSSPIAAQKSAAVPARAAPPQGAAGVSPRSVAKAPADTQERPAADSAPRDGRAADSRTAADAGLSAR